MVFFSLFRQNRTWEKDRRDRLNITFDKLSKLLPEYQPKLTFSKIEILQKSINYIENLREKIKDLLSTKSESILSKFSFNVLYCDCFC